MIFKRAPLAYVTVAILALSLDTTTAAAGGRTTPSLSFFVGHVGPVANGSAHWTKAQSNDADGFSVELEVPEGVAASFSSSFAGADLHVSGSPPPAASPTFAFRSTVTGPSGGSPRLVMIFSDGGRGELRPLTWVANTWVAEGTGPTSSDWDNNGGTCGFLFQVTYTAVLACHPAATVIAAFVVSDSAWLYPATGYTNFIDTIQYGGTVISQPSDNGN